MEILTKEKSNKLIDILDRKICEFNEKNEKLKKEFYGNIKLLKISNYVVSKLDIKDKEKIKDIFDNKNKGVKELKMSNILHRHIDKISKKKKEITNDIVKYKNESKEININILQNSKRIEYLNNIMKKLNF
jgi:hypothetical protein